MRDAAFGGNLLLAFVVAALGHTLVTDEGMKHVGGLTWLTNLDLSGTQVGDAGIAHLAGLKVLQTLSLRKTTVTDAGLSHLPTSISNAPGSVGGGRLGLPA